MYLLLCNVDLVAKTNEGDNDFSVKYYIFWECAIGGGGGGSGVGVLQPKFVYSTIN
jgi:hypothetical protein